MITAPGQHAPGKRTWPWFLLAVTITVVLFLGTYIYATTSRHRAAEAAIAAKLAEERTAARQAAATKKVAADRAAMAKTAARKAAAQKALAERIAAEKSAAQKAIAERAAAHKAAAHKAAAQKAEAKRSAARKAAAQKATAERIAKERNNKMEEALPRLHRVMDEAVGIEFMTPRAVDNKWMPGSLQHGALMFSPYLAISADAVTLRLLINYRAGRWLFWDRIIIMVDEDKTVIQLKRYSDIDTDVTHDALVQERADVVGTGIEDAIRAIAQGSTVYISLAGEHRRQSWRLPPAHIQACQDVLTAHAFVVNRRQSSP